MTAFLGDRSVRGLVQNWTQVFIAFRRATAMVLLRAFFLARTGSHPRPQLRRRRERTGLRPYLRDDRLRRIHSQARYFRESDHGVLMRLHDLRNHALELSHLRMARHRLVQNARSRSSSKTASLHPEPNPTCAVHAP